MLWFMSLSMNLCTAPTPYVRIVRLNTKELKTNGSRA